jgi:hypothetical protein
MAKIGRPPRAQKSVNRTYYVPVSLAEVFRDEMGKRCSKGVAAGMILLLGVRESIREELIELADTLPPAEAVKEVRCRLPEWLDQILVDRHIASLSPKERSRIIQLERKKLPPRSRR